MSFITLILAITLVPVSTQQAVDEYDPWYDINDDGKIDIKDVAGVAIKFGTEGTPINKTELLLELLSKVDDLNASVLELQGHIAVLETMVGGLEATVAFLEGRVETLEAFEVNSTYSFLSDYTTETLSWVDMEYMSLDINLQRTCHIIIIFSTEAEMTKWHGSIMVRAVIDGNPSIPSYVYLTPAITEESIPAHRHSLDYGAYSYSFYQPSMLAGNYTIKMQWKLLALYAGTEGCVRDRTLTILAFPIE